MKMTAFFDKVKRFFKGNANKTYIACGTGMIVLAVAIIVGLVDARSRAQEVHFGDSTFYLENKDGSLIISEVSELIALFQASEEQTQGLDFAIEKDMKINKITKASTGSFAGNFDGRGHVITIDEISIISEGAAGETDNLGIMFGEVTGSVKNLIIDLPNGGSFSRSSELVVTQDTSSLVDSIDETGKAASGSMVSGYLLVVDEETVDFVDDKSITDSQKEQQLIADGYVKGYYQVYTVPGTRTVSAGVEGRDGYDTFGVVCGKNTGTISQVYVTGESNFNVFGVSSEAKSSATVYSGSKSDYYYYTATPISKTSSLSLSDTERTDSDSYLSGNLDIQQLPAKKADGTIGEYLYVYTLTLTNIYNGSDNVTSRDVIINSVSGDDSGIDWVLAEDYKYTSYTTYAEGTQFKDIKFDDTTSGILLRKNESVKLKTVVSNISLSEMSPSLRVNVTSSIVQTVSYTARMDKDNADYTLSNTVGFEQTHYEGTPSTNAANGSNLQLGYESKVEFPNGDGGNVTVTLRVPNEANPAQNNYIVQVTINNLTNQNRKITVPTAWTENSNATPNVGNDNTTHEIEITANNSVTIYRAYKDYNVAKNATFIIYGWDETTNKNLSASKDSEHKAATYTETEDGYISASLYIPEDKDQYIYEYVLTNKDSNHTYKLEITTNGWSTEAIADGGVYTVAGGGNITFTKVVEGKITAAGDVPAVTKIALVPKADNITVSISEEKNANQSIYEYVIKNTQNYTIDVTLHDYIYIYDHSTGKYVKPASNKIGIIGGDTFNVYSFEKDLEKGSIISSVAIADSINGLPLSKKENVTYTASGVTHKYTGIIIENNQAFPIVIKLEDASDDNSISYAGYCFSKENDKVTDTTIDLVADPTIDLAADTTIDLEAGKTVYVLYDNLGPAIESAIESISVGTINLAVLEVKKSEQYEKEYIPSTTYSKVIKIKNADNFYNAYIDLGSIVNVNRITGNYNGAGYINNTQAHHVMPGSVIGGWFFNSSYLKSEASPLNICVGKSNQEITIVYVATSKDEAYNKVTADSIKNAVEYDAVAKWGDYACVFTDNSNILSSTLKQTASYDCKLTLKFDYKAGTTIEKDQSITVSGLSGWKASYESNEAIPSTRTLNRNNTIELTKTYTGYDNACAASVSYSYNHCSFAQEVNLFKDSSSKGTNYETEYTVTDKIGVKVSLPYPLYRVTVEINNASNANFVINKGLWKNKDNYVCGWSYLENGQRTTLSSDTTTVAAGKSITYEANLHVYYTSVVYLEIEGTYQARINETTSSPIAVLTNGTEVNYPMQTTNALGNDISNTVGVNTSDETNTHNGKADGVVGLSSQVTYVDETVYNSTYTILLAADGKYGYKNIKVVTYEDGQQISIAANKDDSNNGIYWDGLKPSLESNGIMVFTATRDTKKVQEDGSEVDIIRSFEITGTVDSIVYEPNSSTVAIVEKSSFSVDMNSATSVDKKLPQSGFSLYAGGIAGENAGTIKEIKYSLPIVASFSDAVDDQNQKYKLGSMGNIVGKNTASDDLFGNVYMTIGGNYVGTDTSYVPANSISSTGQITTLPSTITDSSAWGAYIVANASNVSSIYDLSWLIKPCDIADSNTEDGFFAKTVNNETKIEISLNKIGRTIKLGSVVYNARKSIKITDENEILYNRIGVNDRFYMNIEESGYYRICNIYASDGYYNYYYYSGNEGDGIEQALEAADYYYPYEDNNKINPFSQQILVDSNWTSINRVVNKGDVKDEIVFTMPSKGAMKYNGKLYYKTVTSTDSKAIPDDSQFVDIDITTGKGALAYDADTVVFRVTPYSEGHIYPTVTTVEFSADTIGTDTFPAPTVYHSAHYNSDGSLGSVEDIENSNELFASDKLTLSLIGEDGNDYISSYTIKYIIAESEPSDADWDNAPVYDKEISLTESMIGKTDLKVYTRISKGNYLPSKKASSSFSVVSDKITPAVYTTSSKDVAVDWENGETCISGDIFGVVNNTYGTGNTIEYVFSADAIKDFSTVGWDTYVADSVIQMNAGNPYLYLRIKLNDNEYSNIVSQTFNFGQKAGGVRANPNGVFSTTNLVQVDNGTVCFLSSYTYDADIYYIYTKDVNCVPEVHRVVDVPASFTGTYVEGDEGVVYFKVGKRWYSSKAAAYNVNTNDAKTLKYEDGINLFNDVSNPTNYYLYAFAVADGYIPGDVQALAYEVGGMDKVRNPESTIVTYSSDDTTVKKATVALGDTVSFTSQTPSSGNSNVEFYYSTGSAANDEMIPVPETGVPVTGVYGGEFNVKVQARRAGMISSDIVTFTYSIQEQGRCQPPTSTPVTTDANPKEVIPGDTILLSTITQEATIFYTIDGSTPEVAKFDEAGNAIPAVPLNNTMVYSSRIVMPEQTDSGDNYFTINAITVKDGLLDSEVVRFTFAYPSAISAPYANVAAGAVSLNTDIYLFSTTEDATICYTIAYGDNMPADPTISSMVFNGMSPITITQKTTIKAIALKGGMTSNIITLVYTPMERLAAPSASISSGSVVSNGMTLNISSGSATIYYTLDGSDPTDNANTTVVNGNILTLSGAPGSMITVKAYASLANYSDSEVATFTYQISNANGGISADIASGSSVSSGTKVNLMTDVTGASIYYIVGNGDPTTSGILGNTVTITGGSGESVMVKAVSVLNGSFGTVTTFVYHILEKPDAPIAYPSGGELTTAKYVILTSDAESIYYTTDGSVPTTGSTLYTEPFLVNKTMTVKAIAVAANGEISNVATFNYVAAVKAATPDFSVEDNTVIEPGEVVFITTATTNSTIYYSLDGSNPTIDNLASMMKYDTENGIAVSRTVTIKAVTYRNDLQLSDISICNVVVNTVPGQEIKADIAEAEEAQQLHDSDISGLERYESNANADGNVTLTEDICNTMVTSDTGVLDEDMSIVTEPLGMASRTISHNVEVLYGEEYEVLSLYYTHLVDEGSHIQPEGQVEIGIPIPEDYVNATLTLVQVDSNGRITPLETRREDNMLYATVNKMDMYGIVGIPSSKNSEFEFPMLRVLEILAGLFVMGGIGFAISQAVRRRRSR